MADSVTSDASPVGAAFTVGWYLAVLYDLRELPQAKPDDGVQPDHLPGARGDMSDHERLMACLARAEVALSHTGVDRPPSLSRVEEVVGDPSCCRHRRREALCVCYRELRNLLAGSDTALLTAFSLGQALGDTYRLPHVHDAETLRSQFRFYRIKGICDSLSDLDQALPPDSAAAVRHSLESWREWVGDTFGTEKAPIERDFDDHCANLLLEQAEITRRLLAGEQAAKDLLGPDDYVAAASLLLHRSRGIAAGFVREWWITLSLICTTTIAAVLVAILYAPSEATKAVAVIAAIAGALGLSWKAVGATLGRTLSRVEAELWKVVVRETIGEAATKAPAASARHGRRRLGAPVR
jgi:hypothetical protein